MNHSSGSSTSFRVPLEVFPDAVISVRADGSILHANPAAERLLSSPDGALDGSSVTRYLSDADWRALSTSGGSPGRGRHVCLIRDATGRALRIELAAVSEELDGARVHTVVLREARRRDRRDVDAEVRLGVSRVLASAEDWASTVPRLVEAIASPLGCSAGCVWELDAEAGVLCFGGVWQRDAGADPIVDLARRLAFLQGVGVPGLAWESGDAVWVADRRAGPSPVTASPTLGSGFAVPYGAGPEVLGVLEFFARRPVRPSARTAALLREVGAAIGTFVRGRQRHADLAAREQRFRLLVEEAADAVTLLDARGRVAYTSPAMERMLGYGARELTGKDAFTLLHPDDAPRARKAFGIAVRRRGAELTLEYRVRHRNGTWVTVESKGRNLLTHDAVRGVMVSSRDVSVRRTTEAEAWRLSRTDELTGLLNRRGFLTDATERLRSARRSGREMLLVYGDIDNLKQINDRSGHAAGDQAIRGAAIALARALPSGATVARIGGDELVGLVEMPGRGVGSVLAEIERQVEAWNALHPAAPALGVSVGAARCAPGEGVHVEALLARADAAMYLRKHRA